MDEFVCSPLREELLDWPTDKEGESKSNSERATLTHSGRREGLPSASDEPAPATLEPVGIQSTAKAVEEEE